VIIYPGKMFWLDGNDTMGRLSVNMDPPIKLEEGLNRIKEFCLSLEPSPPRLEHIPQRSQE